MWGVKIAGDHAFLHDTHNGLFVINITDPAKPYFVAHRQLDYVDLRMPKHMGTTPLPGFVGGLALGPGHVYLAGGWSDLHVVAAPGLAEPCAKEPDLTPSIPPADPAPHPRFEIYRPGGQVRGVALLDEIAVVAAGSTGISTIRLAPELQELKRYATVGFAMAVRTLDDRVYVAEEKGGLSIWRHTGGGVLLGLGRYSPTGKIVKDVVVPAPGRYAVVQVGMSLLDIVDVADPSKTTRVFRDKDHGFVYHLGEDLIDGRELCVLFQLGGLRWYELYETDRPGFRGREYPHRLGSGGSVPLADKRLVVYGGGLVSLTADELRAPTELDVFRVANHRLRGRPVVLGDRLYVIDCRLGDITVFDQPNGEEPLLVEQFNVPGNPTQVLRHRGALLIANGYEGLWLERMAGTPD
jgi:hypothetical protein